MPLIRVIRYAPTAVYLGGGTQYVEAGKVLSFPGATTIVLSNAVYGATGDYILFDYSAAGASFPGGQAELNANVVPYIDDSDLSLSAFGSLTDDTVAKKIILSLQSNPTNGCQYIESGVTLDISNPLPVYLNSALYATPGTYILFDWSGGGSFTGSASNITLYPPSGLSVSVAPAVVGSTIQFTLV